MTWANSFAQNKTANAPRYQQITNALESLDNADDFESYFKVANEFQEIAEEGKTKWITFYHTTYAYISAALELPISKEALVVLDTAQKMMDKTLKFGGLGNSEIICLQGYLYYAQQFRNPKNNTNIIARKAIKELDRARFLDGSNPRPYYIIGLVLDQLDPRIGGNTKSACKHFNDAYTRFNDYKPRNEFYPNWGAQDNLTQLNNCK